MASSGKGISLSRTDRDLGISSPEGNEKRLRILRSPERRNSGSCDPEFALPTIKIDLNDSTVESSSLQNMQSQLVR